MGKELVHTSVNVREDQKRWIDDNNLNVSKLFRDLLDDEIEEREGEEPPVKVDE